MQKELDHPEITILSSFHSKSVFSRNTKAEFKKKKNARKLVMILTAKLQEGQINVGIMICGL